MPLITRESLMSLETYSRERNSFRSRVMAHKRHRAVRLGANVRLLFEDELTIRYQVQEMLRAERIFEDAGIRGELDAYNPLVPDGTNWKATMLMEYPDPEERRVALTCLIGIEDRVWVRVEGYDRVYAIADEDLDRDTAEKTSAVHFLRFELDVTMRDALRRGAGVGVGVDHPVYNAFVDPLPSGVRDSLAADLTA